MNNIEKILILFPVTMVLSIMIVFLLGNWMIIFILLVMSRSRDVKPTSIGRNGDWKPISSAEGNCEKPKEVDFSGIKGGGGALLFEKIVAEQSKRIIWIVDESKMVDYLGRFPLPVEVIPYGSEQLFKKFEAKGYRPKFRVLENGERYLTDSQNYIIDLDVFPIKDPVTFGAELKALTGVVEQGLFTNMTETVLIGTPDGVKVQTLG